MASSMTVHFLISSLPFWILLVVFVLGSACIQTTDVRPNRVSGVRNQILVEMIPTAVLTVLLFGGIIIQSRTVYVMGALPLAVVVWLWFENFAYVQGHPSYYAVPITCIYILGFLVISAST